MTGVSIILGQLPATDGPSTSHNLRPLLRNQNPLPRLAQFGGRERGPTPARCLLTVCSTMASGARNNPPQTHHGPVQDRLLSQTPDTSSVQGLALGGRLDRPLRQRLRATADHPASAGATRTTRDTTAMRRVTKSRPKPLSTIRIRIESSNPTLGGSRPRCFGRSHGAPTGGRERGQRRRSRRRQSRCQRCCSRVCILAIRRCPSSVVQAACHCGRRIYQCLDRGRGPFGNRLKTVHHG